MSFHTSFSSLFSTTVKQNEELLFQIKKKKTNGINSEIASIKIQNLELLQGSLLPQQLYKWGMAYFLQSVRDSGSLVKTVDMGTAHCKRRKSEIRKWNEAL